jgi:hypothetical protein
VPKRFFRASTITASHLAGSTVSATLCPYRIASHADMPNANAVANTFGQAFKSHWHGWGLTYWYPFSTREYISPPTAEEITEQMQVKGC